MNVPCVMRNGPQHVEKGFVVMEPGFPVPLVLNQYVSAVC
jgi:hypothetical protein